MHCSRKHLALPSGVALLLLASACGSDIPENQARSTSTAGERTIGETMTLIGCVGVGEEPGQYQLKEIRVDPGLDVGTDPQGDSIVPGVTEGAWVRLDGRAGELERLLGERVRLTGEVVVTGRNTIGTSGAYGYETPSGDASQAASDQHYAEKQKLEAGRIARQSLANGRAATLRVSGISPVGERCEVNTRPEGR
jgi:hypothetical protein